MVSKEYFRSHPNPHVLPTGSDSANNNITPVSEYDYDAEWTALNERVMGGTNRAATDRKQQPTSLSKRVNTLKKATAGIVSRSSTQEETTESQPPNVTQTGQPKAVLEGLRELKKLRDEGVVSPEEYSELKTQLLGRI